MPTVKVNVVPADWPLISPSGWTSEHGHMWLTMPDGKDYGYTGSTVIDNDDSKTYAPGYYTHEIELTDQQLAQLQQFLDTAVDNGFGPNDYNPFTNSCVDFVWEALYHAGVNPLHYDGRIFPEWNEYILKLWFPEKYDEFDEMDDGCSVNSDVNVMWELAQRWRPRGDPIVFDLDGDGVETTAVENWETVKFDHNKDCNRLG
jgi:hypothetical protein